MYYFTRYSDFLPTLNHGGVGHDGAEVELLIVHLILDTRSQISQQNLRCLYVKILSHNLLTKWRYS